MNTTSLVPLTYLQIATFVALLATAIGLWFTPMVWRAALVAATVFGLIAGVVQPLALMWMALAIAACLWYARVARMEHADYRSLIASLIVVTMVLALGMHALPGFHNVRVVNAMVLSPGAEPFTMYLNFDKTLAGVLLLGLCDPDERSWRAWRASWRWSVVGLIAANVVLLICLSYALGYVRFEGWPSAPKWSGFFALWAAVNLFSTCLSEEAFFRGFIQRTLQARYGDTAYGNTVALLVSAVLFGVAHFAGGWRYVLLATAAGIGYGYIYRRTRRIEWAMLAHFALNATHFLFFTYPRVAI